MAPLTIDGTYLVKLFNPVDQETHSQCALGWNKLAVGDISVKLYMCTQNTTKNEVTDCYGLYPVNVVSLNKHN